MFACMFEVLNTLNPWAKAGVLEKKADDIKVEHKESDDNALYSSGREEGGMFMA